MVGVWDSLLTGQPQPLSEGQPIAELDMMIAAHSLSAGASLITNNISHYVQMKSR
jgi:tRNA(fMet)-specific endonuclease VapC